MDKHRKKKKKAKKNEPCYVKKLRDQGIHHCWHSVVTDLDEIYEVVELVSEKGQIVPKIQLSKMNDRQKELAKILLEK